MPWQSPPQSVPDVQANVRKIGIHLADLMDHFDADVRRRLIGNSLDLEGGPIRTGIIGEGKKEEIALAFSCPLLTAAMICDTLRAWDKEEKRTPIRVYLLRKVWSRASGEALLSVLRNGLVALNPQLFSVEIQPMAASPPRNSGPINWEAR